MNTYLVTGCAGFIGSKVAEFLLKEGHEVVGIDNLNNYYDLRLKDYRLGRLLDDQDWQENTTAGKSYFKRFEECQNGRFRFHCLDLENSDGLHPLFEKYQFAAVFNLAARAGVRYSMQNPHIYMSTNAVGTLNLMECMRKTKVAKLILASTSSLYAGQQMPFSEDLPVNTPISPYAASKKAAEVMAYSYHYLYGLDVSVVRYFTVFGPAGRPDMSIFRFIKWIDQDKPIELFGDGSQSRDFTYIDDIARGTILAQRNLGYEIINLGGGKNPISLNTIINKIEERLGKDAIYNYKPFHKADIKETWADIGKAERLLDWKPLVDPLDGLDLSVKWYIENRKILRDIEL